MELMKLDNNLTMSSREIAELLDARHDSVKRSIERCIVSRAIAFTPLVEASFTGSDGRTQYGTVFSLDKRSSLIVVAQMSPEFTAKIVDRWQELESKEQKNRIILPNFTDPIEAATAWIEQYKEKTEALKQLEVAKPKAEYVDKYVERGNLKSVTDVAKEMGVSGKVLGAWLRKEGYTWVKHKKLRWSQPFMDKGYGEMKKFTSDSGYDGTQVMVTPTGDLFIKQNFVQE